MNIYVKSRGVSKGYSWLDESQKEIPDPRDLKEAIQIVDSDDFSIVLRRLGGQLFLLITGLESQNRTDNRTRKIRNSVLWVADGSQEGALRAIATQALGGELAPKVDEAVSSTNKDVGFQVDFEKLTFEKLVSEPLSQGELKDLTSKIGNLSELKGELIEELKKYSLPKKEGILLVVSPTVSQGILKRNSVWRGLSDTIDAQDDWIVISDTGAESSLDTTRKGSQEKSYDPLKWLEKLFSAFSFQTAKTSQRARLIAAFLLGLIVATLGHLSLEADQQQRIEEQRETIKEQEETIQNQTEKINQLNAEVDKLRGDLNGLVKEIETKKKEIETKKQEIKAYQKFGDELDKSLNALKANTEKLCGSFQNECQQLYQSSQKNLERSQKALEDQLNALKNKSDSSEDKAS